ncbi:peptidase U35 [Heyndrickxia shackletonii]|uniref:Peptidase U35 n=1 Tax=Heyndrickxia shackletonii TaxID=157838 RepID=A0A0Q3X0L8_9BACI|nr:HK97 family phage prohead protease [Heyndrickxia shackletonii]KQL55503.1 peptidase U35 [Heyndrickxia shackletonii]NEY99248.1 HK97 family phage prohead protease [Heyndrickxia shackletonii]
MRIEIRGDQVLLDGYVNAVARESRVLPSPNGRFKEQIVPKTFERALQRAENVDLLFNHDRNRNLGSIKQGNLELFEDTIGLRAIATVTDEDIIQKAKNGALKGWSFGFIANKDRWEDGENGIQKRYIEDLDLLEVSILDKTPAYIATSIEARGEETLITEQRNEEFKASIEDLTKLEDKKEERELDYSLYEKEIELLKLKGGKF